MVILILAHSAEDKANYNLRDQMFSVLFQVFLICQIQGLLHGSWMREIWRYWPVTMVPVKKADGKLKSCSSCNDEQRQLSKAGNLGVNLLW